MGNITYDAIGSGILNPDNIRTYQTVVAEEHAHKLTGLNFRRIPDGMRLTIDDPVNPEGMTYVLGYYECNYTAMAWLVVRISQNLITDYDILDVGINPVMDTTIAREWQRHQPGADDAIWDLLGLTIEIKMWGVKQQEGPCHTVALPLGLPGRAAVMMLQRLAAKARNNTHDITHFTIGRINKEDPRKDYTGLHYLQLGYDVDQGVITWQMYENGWRAFVNGKDEPIYESGSLVPPSSNTHAYVWRLHLAGAGRPED